MFDDKNLDTMFGLSRLGNMLDPKRAKAMDKARQTYGPCALGGKCAPGGSMCIPCAFAFKAADNA